MMTGRLGQGRLTRRQMSFRSRTQVESVVGPPHRALLADLLVLYLLVLAPPAVKQGAALPSAMVVPTVLE